MKQDQEKCKGLSDKEVIQRSLEDINYFACLFNRYEKQMLNFIQKISSFSREESEDILQEAFIRIWINVHDFDSDLSFKSWLYRIVHNHTISQWRKNNTRESRDQEYALRNTLLQSEPGEFEKDPAEQQSILIKTAVDQLKIKYRDVIILKYFENLSYEEISDILKIPEGTVATRINRAKKILQKSLGGITFFN